MTRSPLQRFWFFSLLGFLYYAFMRVEFFLWNQQQFHDPQARQILLAFAQGLRFDAVALFLLSTPLFLLAWIQFLMEPKKIPGFSWLWKIAAVFTLILHFFMMSLSLIDNEFVNFTGKRFSLDTVFILREGQDKVGNFLSSYWKLWMVNPLMVFSFLFFSWLILNRKLEKGWGEKPTWIKKIALGFVAVAVFVIGARGGLQMKPLNFVDSRVFEAPLMNQMVLNSAFTMLKSSSKKKIPRYEFFKEAKDLESALNSFSMEKIEPLEKLKTQIKAGRSNIVVIILESFSVEYMGLDGRTSYTPFLDSLAKQGLFFKNGFADGRRSIEGVGAILAGIPAWMEEPFISSEFATNQFLGLGTWFKGLGYQTSFFHGGKNGTMYFDSFAKSTGFDEYFGFNEYPNKEDFDGTWGVFDEPFLQFMVEKLKGFPQPFASTVFTLSSHQPYRIPDQYQQTFLGGPVEILKSVQYADFALKKFFESAEKEPWFKNTVFVLTADHTGRAVSKEFDHEVGYYQIPILIYSPGQPVSMASEKVFTQIDLFPSLQDLFGETPSPLLLGRSVFSKDQGPAILYTEDRYLVVDAKHVLTWSQAEGAKFYERAPWPKPVVVDDEKEKSKYENYLKAHLQKFSQGLYDNKLYYPDRK